MIIKTIPLNQYNWISAVFIFPMLLLLAACTSSGNAIPQGGSTMAQIYEEAMQHSNAATLQQVRQTTQPLAAVAYNGTAGLSAYPPTADNEMTKLFPLLPNPQVMMYVYPHLAGNNETPIPGYVTAFPLYKQLHYAMPGEV